MHTLDERVQACCCVYTHTSPITLMRGSGIHVALFFEADLFT